MGSGPDLGQLEHMTSVTSAWLIPSIAWVAVSLVGAVLDRFLRHAEMITITGPSYRLHERKKKGLEIPEPKE